MGNNLSESEAHLALDNMSLYSRSQSEVIKYKRMDGCFILKVKKLKVPEKSLQRIKNDHPDINLAELQLMLSFRGQQYLLQTLKEDFHMLNKPYDDENMANSPTAASVCSPNHGPQRYNTTEISPLKKRESILVTDQSLSNPDDVTLNYKNINIT